MSNKTIVDDLSHQWEDFINQKPIFQIEKPPFNGIGISKVVPQEEMEKKIKENTEKAVNDFFKSYVCQLCKNSLLACKCLAQGATTSF